MAPVRPALSPQVDGPNSQTTLLEETCAIVWSNPYRSTAEPSAGVDHYLSFPRPGCLVTSFPRLGPQLRLRQVQLHRNYRRFCRSRCVHVHTRTRTPCLYEACYGKWPPLLPRGKKLRHRWRTSDQSLRAGVRQLRLMYVLHSRPHSHSMRTSFANFGRQSYKGGGSDA
jgi:hypothetical protein